MIHPLIINNFGKIQIYSEGAQRTLDCLKKQFRQIFNQPLRPSTILMNEIDFKDVLAWSKESDQ